MKEAKTGARNTQTFRISTGIESLCKVQKIIAEVLIKPFTLEIKLIFIRIYHEFIEKISKIYSENIVIINLDK